MRSDTELHTTTERKAHYIGGTMPGSVRENDSFVRDFAYTNQINSVLDIGPGQGTYSDLLRDLVPIIDAVEVWTPYIYEYSLHSKYQMIENEDARDFLPDLRDAYRGRGNAYDLIIFGDVLEHMTEAEALTCWSQASKISQWGLISVPIVHYPQGAEGGNPYEVHVQDHLTPEKVREVFGPFDHEAVYNITGTFIKRF